MSKPIFSNSSCFALYVDSGRHPRWPMCAYRHTLAVWDAAFGAGNFLIRAGKNGTNQNFELSGLGILERVRYVLGVGALHAPKIAFLVTA